MLNKINLKRFFIISLLLLTSIFCQSTRAYETEKRDYIRFDNSNISTPITLKNATTNEDISILDFSRGGVAICNDEFKIGEIIPVIIIYKALAINTEIQIVFNGEKKSGAKFINTNKNIERQLLQLNLLLEGENETFLGFYSENLLNNTKRLQPKG
jgi:hypothetical protein